ncbi:TlpA disulfide reductase family protein [Thalassolituus sp.]|jgi:thiol-disulfide isomerase/thioredoxin|uniref:TlpA family protein disulfide reductase n=1 Tax=Thalassolituus sp. TaxID=2030822 RepID=UPI002A8403E8|nr:TlpA disulfide reductase family protein [Thalassolituus sp.]
MTKPVFPKLSKNWTKRLWWAQWPLYVLLFLGVSHSLNRHLLDEGSKLPNLALYNQAGEPTTLKWPQPEQTIVLYVFAPWCSICRVSMPGLNLIPPERAKVIGIALDWDNAKQVEDFVESTGFRGEWYLGGSKITAALKVTGYPSYYVVSGDGVIKHRDRGLTTPPGLWLRTMPDN